MDIGQIATFLAPLLPYLVKGGIEMGKAAAEKLGEKITEESWDGLKTLGKKIRKKAGEKPAAKEAIEDLDAAPEDKDAAAAVRLQLKKLLTDDPDLKKEAETIVGQIVNLSHSERSVVIDKAEMSQIATGDGVMQVGRDLVQHFHEALSAADDATSLRAAYLNHVLETTSQLQLSGIDPKTASDAEARLNLGAVYTALLTHSTETTEAMQKPRRTEVEAMMERGETRRASALEQLNRYTRLVLLGDPGSGKSTFVNFAAMCLAGEALKNKDANLAALTAPLPVSEEDRPRLERAKEKKPQSQPWDHGALLPLRVILRDFAARGLPPVGEKASAKTLWSFITNELDAWALCDYEEPLERELRQTGGLLLLDGLDEVPEADQRRAQIKQAVEDFAASFPKVRILVTSRTYAYQKQDWRMNNFDECVLAPFSRGQIRNFVERWYAHIAVLRHQDPEDARGRAELLKRAIFNSDRLIGLAERPLLLTLMASLHAWRGGTLPEKREELYADAVELLLDWWESPKAVRNAQGKIINQQPSLAEWLKVDRQKVRALLEELAFKTHALQQELTGTADISESDLVGGLMHLSQNPDVNPRQLVDYLSLRAGLLIPRGVGVYTFPHRTFQEYLAACHLTDHDYPEKVAELACTDINRWREVALLAGSKAARGTASAIWSLVDALCHADPTPAMPEKQQWGALLAGQALVESGSQNNVSERNLPKKQRVQNGLVTILETGRLPAVERASAGDTLARLGDPRPGISPLLKAVGVGEAPSMGMSSMNILFCEIPAGKFLMGSQDDPQASSYEQPQFSYEKITRDFFIARYPVTNAQFDAFVTDPQGYLDDRWWTKDGWKWRKSEKREMPPKFGGVFDLPNHPAVNIAWYEAYAFTQWLSDKLKSEGFKLQVWRQDKIETMSLDGKAWQVRLPSEAEWERAARGPHGWRYPWGDKINPNRANYDETGIGATSAVGCFPSGQNPWGLLDMSGNVWEWCATQWTEDYKNYRQKESNDPEGDSPRVVRGGAFYFNDGSVRCACRGWHDPLYSDGARGFRVVVSPV